MSNDKIEKPATSRAATDRIPVAHLWFHSALDFPGVQESNVKCCVEPTPTGRSYTAVFIPILMSFELTLYQGAKREGQRMIPLAQVKQYALAG